MNLLDHRLLVSTQCRGFRRDGHQIVVVLGYCRSRKLYVNVRLQ